MVLDNYSTFLVIWEFTNSIFQGTSCTVKCGVLIFPECSHASIILTCLSILCFPYCVSHITHQCSLIFFILHVVHQTVFVLTWLYMHLKISCMCSHVRAFVESVYICTLAYVLGYCELMTKDWLFYLLYFDRGGSDCEELVVSVTIAGETLRLL